MTEAPGAPALEPPRQRWWRRALPWLGGGLLWANIALLVAVLSLANVTGEGPAKRGLAHGVAVLTEIDGYLATHYEAFRQEAATTSERTLAPPNFPVPVSFTPDEVLSSSREEFRTLLLARAADKVYEDGMASFGADDSGGDDVSGEDVLRVGMDFLRPSPHRVLTGLTIGLAAMAALLSAALLLTSRSLRAIAGLGLAVFVASGALLIAAIGVRFAFRLAADGADDTFVREFLRLAQELTWAPIRNGIIFTSGGALLAALGGMLSLWQARRTA